MQISKMITKGKKKLLIFEQIFLLFRGNVWRSVENLHVWDIVAYGVKSVRGLPVP